MKQITWQSKKVLTSSIDPTPTNYKIKSDLGKERLRQSLKAFGMAGNVACNYSDKSGRWDIIDGNSRWEQAVDRKEKFLWISIPSRRLTPKEYKEMSAMFDFAKAGDVDVERIEQDLGTTKDFFDKWGMLVPASILQTLGKNQKSVGPDDTVEGNGKSEDPYADGVAGSLRERFIEPPFSVLDSKNGNWQARKKVWLALGIQSELGRDEVVFKDGAYEQASAKGGAFGSMKLGKVKRKNLLHAIPMKKYGNVDEYYSKEAQEMNTSIFDPALCELMYTWFCPKKGTVIDPFAGGSVRGIVANYMGYRYWGVDLSRKQIEANRKQGTAILKKNNQPVWYAGDSEVLLNKKWDQKFDFVFSCPPYYDLEVYSKDKDDISNFKTYELFLVKYKAIITLATKLLKPNRYACFVVSEIRDKKGYYRGFVKDTISSFKEAGLELYNDAVLLNAVGSASMRATRIFTSGKKLVRIHQNVLVFYKP